MKSHFDFCLLFIFAWGLIISPAIVNAQLHDANASIETAIDHYVNAELIQQNIQPADHATDANLIRRTMLDLVGRIPTARESQEYIQSSDPDKRVKLTDRLLADPAYVRHQTLEFDAMLMQGSGRNLQAYLRQAISENRPWNQMFREMLLGTATQPENPQDSSLQFVRARVNDTDKLANETSVLFFGVNVSCAKCHDHPLVDDWKQDHFYGMKSFFNRTFEQGEFVGERDYGFVNYKTTEGEERTAKLMFLSGEAISEPESKEPTDEEKKAEQKRLEAAKKDKSPPAVPTFSRREKLVEAALNQNEDGFLARAIVNRIWYRFIGYGLVMPLDQMHSENESSHPELLKWLARDLVQHNYDLQHLIRGIVLSDVYARSSVWSSAGDRPSEECFAVANVRPLSPHQYAMSLRLAGTNPDHLLDLDENEFQNRIESIENSARGIAREFEVPGDQFRISSGEALLLTNNDRIQLEFIREDKQSLFEKLKSIDDQSALVETAVWNVWSRSIEDEERTLLASFLNDRSDRKPDAIKLVIWTLLTSSESRFNY